MPLREPGASNRVRDLMLMPRPAIDPSNPGCNRTLERDLDLNMKNSLSKKLAFPHSPSQSEIDSMKSSSSKVQYNPVRKMFQPFTKSKSKRSTMNCANSTRWETKGGLLGISSDKRVLKSMPPIPRFEEKENRNLVIPCSPAHILGVLRSGSKSFFEFSVKSQDHLYVAKAMKVANALTCVYTFHSLHHGRKSNASGWGYKDHGKGSSIAGQMHALCYPCTEVKVGGTFTNLMVTEFVLYDISHLRKSISTQNNSCFSTQVVKAPLDSEKTLSSHYCEVNEVSTTYKNKGQLKNSQDNGHFESSASHPLSVAELHPGLEIAAIIMEVPSEKKIESLKFKNGDTITDEQIQEMEGVSESSHGNMYVVIPAGNHSLPSTGSRGPSPILDRWRLVGRCDCSGWDMACPLDVFGNANIKIANGQPFVIDSQHPIQLFNQGRKDEPPSFRMKLIEEGKYAVEFHARLSSLQAFSICVAMLHIAEASAAAEQNKSKQMLDRVSSKVETRKLINETAEEEKFHVNKKMEEILPCIALDPPFSPIARV